MEFARPNLSSGFPMRRMLAFSSSVEFIRLGSHAWIVRDGAVRTGRPAVVFAPRKEALDVVADFARLGVLYWLHRSQRDLVTQSPGDDGTTRGMFALRSPVRPNAIGAPIVTLVGIEGTTLLVRGLDYLDGTPLLDIKPGRDLFTPLAPQLRAIPM